MASFNLVDQPWIPCVRPDGTRVHLGLRDLFVSAHTVSDIAHDSPLVEVAVYRLLLAILHRVVDGPRNMHAWRTLYSAKRFDPAPFSAYLDRWHGRFDLFDGQHPFMQVAGLTLTSGGKVVPAGTLARIQVTRATGNNGTLFDHALDDVPTTLSAADATLHLLETQTWALGGGKGPTSNVFGDHPYASHAPLVGRVHFRVRRSTLFESLVANASGLLDSDDAKDVPQWERSVPRSLGEVRPDGLVDLLTLPARMLRLVPSDDGSRAVAVVYAPGVKVTDDADLWPIRRDPGVATRLSKDAIYPVFMSDSRATWRDFGALAAQSRDAGTHDGRPTVVRALFADETETLLDGQTIQTIVATGLANDKAKPLSWCRDVIPFHARAIQDEALGASLTKGLARAEEVGSEALHTSLRIVATHSLSNGSDRVGALSDSMVRHGGYWAELEPAFGIFATRIGDEEDAAVSAWFDAIRVAARRHFVTATAAVPRSARGLRAVALGEASLQKSLAKLLPAAEAP